MTDIRVPNLGESVTEATVARWLKAEGDAVAADEPLVELETDKVSVEVPAPAAGTLSEIAAKDGETVSVGALLGQIAAGGIAAKAAPEPAAKAPPAKGNGSGTTPPAPDASTKGYGAEDALRQGSTANAPSGPQIGGAQNDVGSSGATAAGSGGAAENAASPSGPSPAGGGGTEIRVPALGESVTEATVAKILKKQGDSVAADEAVVELETDKVSLEVPSPRAGTIQNLAVQEGDTVAVGALLGSVGGAAAAAGAADRPLPGAAAPSPVKATPASARHEPGGNGGMPPAPSARKAMDEAGLSAADVAGSGRRGQVLKGDVIAAIERGATAAPAAAQAPAPATQAPAAPAQARAPSPAAEAEREERVPMTRLRRTIARRLKDAQNTAAMLTTFNDADMSAVMELRTAYKETFEKKHKVKLGFMAFFSKACVQALKDIPAVNAEIDGDDLVYKNYYHIGVAVGTDKGLVVPVVRDADQKSFAEIEKTINDFGRRARDGQLKIDEMQGGTFTITNGGIYGSLMSTPILNAPQAGILGMHRIDQRPVAVKGQVVIRPMMYLALSYDHRIVDGKEAVTFLVRVKEAIEDPQRMLLDL